MSLPKGLVARDRSFLQVYSPEIAGGAIFMTNVDMTWGLRYSFNVEDGIWQVRSISL